MTDIYLVVLAIETEANETDPGSWDWTELTDSPHPVDVVASLKSLDDLSVRGNLQRLANTIID